MWLFLWQLRVLSILDRNVSQQFRYHFIVFSPHAVGTILTNSALKVPIHLSPSRNKIKKIQHYHYKENTYPVIPKQTIKTETKQRGTTHRINEHL